MVRLLFLMIAAHALCDIPLQGDFLSRAKRGIDPNFPAWLALFYHGMIHAGAVLLITGSMLTALGEVTIHALTDAAKCRNHISGKVDQAIHLGCKLVWLLLIWKGL